MRRGRAACWTGKELWPGTGPARMGGQGAGRREGALPLSLIHGYVLVSSHVPGAGSGATEEGGMAGGKKGPNNSPVVGPTASPRGRGGGYWEMSHLGPDGKRPQVPAHRGPGSFPLAWRGHPCLDSGGTGGRLGRPGPRAALGVSEGQGLLAKSLQGPETEIRNRPTLALCKGFWEFACPLLGMKGAPGVSASREGGLRGADPP